MKTFVVVIESRTTDVSLKGKGGRERVWGERESKSTHKERFCNFCRHVFEYMTAKGEGGRHVHLYP